MDWSNFSKLYTFRQTIKNSTDQTEINKAKKEEKELLSNSSLFDINGDKKVDIEDLICFSTAGDKDLDNKNGITDDEKDFITEMKDSLYDKLAKEINKNDEFKVSDMLELESKFKDLSENEKKSAGEYVEKLQNRMVSNLTSQFFVTKETASYKENAINGAIEIWEAQNKIDEWKVSDNNPFNDKFENLLEKLESRVIRTLSEDYTEKSIQDAKNTKNAEALVKKSDSDEPDYDLSKFKFEANILYYDGNKFTGTYAEKYYQEGTVLTGIAYKDGNYYVAGVPGNGAFPNISGSDTIGTFWVVDGKILYQDQVDTFGSEKTVRTYYKSYVTRDEEGKVVNDAVINEIITYDGKLETGKLDINAKISSKVNYEDGKKVSTETYTYNTDGSYAVKIEYEDKNKDTEFLKYTTTGELFTGTGVYDGRLFENNKLKQGTCEYGGRLYVDGIMPKGGVLFNGTLYLDGEKLTGIYNLDGKYYVEGKILAVTTDSNGLVYRYGTLAQGIIEEDGKYNYYVAGVKVSEADEKIGKFIVDRFIENVEFKKENGEFNYKSFTGIQMDSGMWKPVEYEITDEKNFNFTVEFESDIKLLSVYKNGIVDEAKYIFVNQNGKENTEVNLNINGSKSDTGIDYSLQYIDIDGSHNTVQISNAIGDNLTYVYKYVLDVDEYKLTDTKIVIGSINDIQSGKLLTEYPLSDNDNKISYVEIKDKDEKITGIKVTDESLSGVKIEQTFGLDGKVQTGLVTFKNPAEGENATITINKEELCKINGENVVITVPQKDENGNIVKYTVTTYKNDGTKVGDPVEITDPDGTAKSFTEKININLSDVQDIKIEDGKVTKIKLEGKEYNVTYDGEKIILKSGENIEKRFLNNVVIYEKEPSFAGIVTIERTEKGVQTLYRVDFDENSYTEYKYDSETGKLASETYKTEEKQIAKAFAPDGKTVVSTEITEYDKGAEKSVIKYAGSKDDNKITYKKEYNKDGHAYVEKIYDVSKGNVVEESVMDNATETTPKTLTVKEMKADGTTAKLTTITTYGSDDKVTSITKKDENNLVTEKTTYTETGKTVETYVYSASSDTVNQTTIDTYNTDNIITKTEVIDNANADRIAMRITYENGLKTKVESFIDFYTNGNPKSSKIIEYRGGNIEVRNIIRTYTEDGKYTDKVNDTITEINGKPVAKEHLDFAQSIGLALTDIEYDEDNNLKAIYGTRFNDARISVYSEWSVNSSGQYSYIEEITLAGNGTSKTDDDVTYITRVENNVQKYARIVVKGNSYPVNVNGAEINDKLDISIGTELIDDIAKQIKVSDVLFDGVVRQRIFNLNSSKQYDLTNGIVIGSLEDANDSTKSVPVIKLPSGKDITISEDNTKATVPLEGNKVPVFIKGTKAYDIVLAENSTFTITKDGNSIKIQSSYKDGNKTVTTTYKFNEDGGYSKIIDENGTEIIYTYGPNGSTLKSMSINGAVIENPSISGDQSTVSVTKAYDATNGKLGYVLTYALKKTETQNIGDLLNGGKVKFADNKELTLGSNDKVTISEDGKSCSVTTKVSDSLTVVKTYDKDMNVTGIKLNNVELDTKDCAVKFVNSSGTEVTDLSTATKLLVSTSATAEKIGYEYEYALTSSDSVHIGDKTATKVKFVSSAGIPDITQSSTVTATVSEDGKSCTVVEKLNDNVTITKSIKADGTYTAVKINNKAIDFGTSAKSVTVDSNNITITTKDDASNTEQIYKYAIKANSANNVQIGDFVERKLKFSNNKDITLTENDTVSYKDGKVTVKVANSKVSDTYDSTGTRVALQIGDSNINLDGVTVSYNDDKTEITLKRENSTSKVNYELVYNVSTGSIKSGKLTKGSETATISANSIVNEDENGYISVQSGDELFIYSPSLIELNELLNLSYENYVKLTEALKAYNATLSDANKIKLENIKSVSVDSNSVTFTINSNSNYTEAIVYKSSNGNITKKFTIGKQVFTVPKAATISVAGGKITISYTNGSLTKTIELSKSATDKTYYDKVKYDNGSLEDISEETFVTLRADGQIIK